MPGLYANRFTGGGEMVCALYNATPTTVRGDPLRIPMPPKSQAGDAWRGVAANVRRVGAAAIVDGEIGPYDVGYVAVRWGTR